MKYILKPTHQFKKDVKQCQKRGLNTNLLSDILKLLADDKPLPSKCHDHPLNGNFAGCRECHILPYWLLIYEKTDSDLIIYLTRTGTHSDLF